MHDNECFTIFIIQFEWEAYKTRWNYNTLQFTLHHALLQWIKYILCLAPKQTTYDGYKALVTQVDQHYWEDQSENMALQTSWNTPSNTNWQAGVTNSTHFLIPINPANSVPCFPPGQGPSSINQFLELHPPAQLNATNLHKALEPLDANSNDLKDTPDSTND
ncbi:hypothetical protein J132_05502 [Termitomyces sp. J132]|nr:hypothetical protein C0989_004642 [Termitomyces sp. Mn162]KNZ77397.1 hypothetical protein J132_05502 [Termitomyces sp. J132]